MADLPRGQFVVRRHTRDLVHQLFLQIGDRFSCWSIDKGPSPSQHEARVCLEEDPIDRLDAYHEEPDRLLWDAGIVRPHVDPEEGLARGKLLFDLIGFKLKGTWTLARGRGRPRGRGKPWVPSKEWVLLKKPDAWADPKGHYSTASILSGLLPDDDREAVRRRLIEALPALDPITDLTLIQRMEPGAPRPPFAAEGWIFELDPEGIPVLASPGALRSSIDLTALFPEIAAAVRHLSVKALLDGEIVVLDGEGRPDPVALSKRLSSSGTDPAVLFTFDLLALEGRDLRSLPLLARKAYLSRLLPALGPLMYADHLAGRGDALAEEVGKRGGFGILARRADAPYVAGPSEDRVAFEIIQQSDPPAPAPERAGEGLSDLKVRLSNLDKIFWPEERYTKGDLLRYYRTVAPWLLPHLIDRPLVLTRYPDGIHGKSFFQHNAPGSKSAWLRTVRIEMSKRPRDYFLADDLESLLYLVNLGTIPLHLWPSRVQDLDRPDWCCIDIDPGTRGFGDVVQVALAIRDLCQAIELPSFPKTTGGGGLHVLLPLARRLTYEQSRALGELISRTIAGQLPELATLELAIADRGGRVFLDHLVNARGRMLVSPYSVRPLPGATVSTPISWDEVDQSLDPKRFTMLSVPDRLTRGGDPWRDLLAVDTDIGAAIDRLGSLIRSSA